MRETFIKHSPESSNTETVQDRFSKIMNSTMCPFAAKSRIEFANEWRTEATFEENIVLIAQKLKEFTDNCAEMQFDGFVVEVKGEEFSKNLDALSSLLRKTLIELERLDPKTHHSMSKNVLDEKWQFSFNETALFIITFAPFYPYNSPRHSFSNDSVFIFFQPDSSFNAHIVTPAADLRTLKLKKRIRDMFAADGRPYDETLVESPYEALKYVKPLHIGDPEVKWWESK